MNRWTLLTLFILSLFAMQPLSADHGEWFDQWKSIKAEYEDEVGNSRPREAFLGIVKTAKISPSLKKMDRYYGDLQDLEGKAFRKKFKKFKKAFDTFTSKKDSNMNFLENESLTRSVSTKQKKAVKKLQDETDELEKEIRRFIDEIDDDKREDAVIRFDLITCDEATATLIEPEGIISVRCTLSDKAMKKYKKTISKKVKKKLKEIKTELETKLIELDNQFLDELLGFIENEQVQSKGGEHLQSAQELWAQAKQKAETEIQDVVNQEWIKIRQAKVRYRKYRIEAAKSIGKKLFALGSAIGRLVGSNGADVTAYISIARTTVQLVLEVKDLMEEPESVSERLAQEVAAYNRLHAELQETPNTAKQAKLAIQESNIRKDILALKNKAAGLVEKASKLGRKIDELEVAKNEMEKIEDVDEVEKLQEKIAAADEKIKALDEKHDEILNRLTEAEGVIEASQSAFDDQEPAKLLVAKEKLEDALDKIQKAKTVCEKMFEIAETVGVF